MRLVDYFGDHIPHLAEKFKPLRDMEKESLQSNKVNMDTRASAILRRSKASSDRFTPNYSFLTIAMRLGSMRMHRTTLSEDTFVRW